MKKALILLFILVFPSAVYIFLVAGKEKSFIRLAYYGPKRVLHLNENGKIKTDTAFYQIPPFAFTDQAGKSLNSKTLSGNVWVVCFTHVHDERTAAPLAVLMNRVEERTDLDTNLRMVTFALDSESAKSLQEYATTIHAGKKREFVSGKPGEVNQLAIDGFYKPTDTSFANGLHHFFLVDREGHVRGIYNGTLVKDVDKLIDDINILEAAYYVQKNIEEEKKGKDKESDPM